MRMCSIDLPTGRETRRWKYSCLGESFRLPFLLGMWSSSQRRMQVYRFAFLLSKLRNTTFFLYCQILVVFFPPIYLL